MKKITSLFIMMLLMSLVMFNGKQVKADEPVENGNVSVTTVLPDENIITHTFNYEGTYSPDEVLEGHDFVYHVVNGKVANVPEGGFKFHTGMEIISVFTQADKKVALFLDTNGEYLGVDYVTNTAPTAPEGVTTDLSKPGFKVSETPFGPLEVIEEHTIFFVNYEKESTDQLEIKLNNDDPQTVQMNDVVKLENETAVLWLENGLPIWYGTEYSFTALSNRTITTETGAEPGVLVSSIKHLILRGDGSLSHLGQVYIPDDLELIEVGYLLHTVNNLELTMDTEGVTILRSNSVNEFRNEFLRTVSSDNEMNTNVRAYAVVSDGNERAIVYEQIKLSWTVTFKDGEDVLGEVVVENGELVEPIENPVKAGHNFMGWLLDEVDFDFDTPITENLELVADWEVAELTQLPAPVNGLNHNPGTYHVGVGVYDGGTGYSGQLRFVWFDKVTNEPIASDLLNAPAKQGYAYFYSSFLENLPAGTYIVRFQAVGDQVLGSDSEFSIHTFEVTKALPLLDDPVITLNETTASWNAVVNATSYEVYVNDVLQTEGIVDLTFILPTEVGAYTIKVVALADGYQSSEAEVEHIVISEEATALDAPVISLDSETSVVSWDIVSGAVGYELYVGETMIEVSGQSYDLTQSFFATGTYTLTVVALGDGVNDLDSLPSNELTYEVEASLTQLNAITADDFIDLQFHFIDGYASDQNQRRLKAKMDHEVFKQEGMSGKIKVVVFVDGVAHSEEFAISGETVIWYYGFDNSFLPDTLGEWSGTNQSNYVVHFIIVAEDNSGYANSEPFVTSINW